MGSPLSLSDSGGNYSTNRTSREMLFPFLQRCSVQSAAPDQNRWLSPITIVITTGWIAYSAIAAAVRAEQPAEDRARMPGVLGLCRDVSSRSRCCSPGRQPAAQCYADSAPRQKYFVYDRTDGAKRVETVDGTAVIGLESAISARRCGLGRQP
jgi:hypothetical protein